MIKASPTYEMIIRSQFLDMLVEFSDKLVVLGIFKEITFIDMSTTICIFIKIN